MCGMFSDCLDVVETKYDRYCLAEYMAVKCDKSLVMLTFVDRNQYI